ncbi:MAG: hypothetical protein WBR56_20280 [Sedimenticolaceae bacterium]
MQAADPGEGNNLPEHWRFNPSWFGGFVFMPSEFDSYGVVAAVFTKYPAQVALVEHDDVV